jgi:hypothetical protein
MAKSPRVALLAACAALGAPAAAPDLAGLSCGSDPKAQIANAHEATTPEEHGSIIRATYGLEGLSTLYSSEGDAFSVIIP